MHIKILFITDIHQNFNALKKIKFNQYDKIFCGGDILDPHKPDIDIALKIIQFLPVKTYIVPGNCDRNRQLLLIMKHRFNFIHKKTVFIQNIPLTGIGYCRPMIDDIKIYRKYFMQDTKRVNNFIKQSKFPILLKFCGISLENDEVVFLPEKQIISKSKNFIRKFQAFKEKNILKFIENQKQFTHGIILSHSPPRGGLDQIPGLPPIGSTSIYQSIKILKPKLILCGHFHELSGQQMIDNTLIFNPGALKDNFYGEIYITGKKIIAVQKKI